MAKKSFAKRYWRWIVAATGLLTVALKWLTSDYRIESIYGVGCSISKDFMYTQQPVLLQGISTSNEACVAISQSRNNCLTIDKGTVDLCRKSSTAEITSILSAKEEVPVFLPWKPPSTLREEFNPLLLTILSKVLSRGGASCADAKIPAIGIYQPLERNICLATMIDEKEAVTAGHCLMKQPGTVIVKFQCGANPEIKGICQSRFDPHDAGTDMARCTFDTAIPQSCLGSRTKLYLDNALPNENAVNVTSRHESSSCTKVDQGTVKNWDDSPVVATWKGSVQIYPLDSGGGVTATINKQQVLVGVTASGADPNGVKFAPIWRNRELWISNPTEGR